MKWENVCSKMLATVLAAVVTITGMTISEQPVEAAVQTSTLTVDMTAETGDILHGASGFLYGISNEDVPTTNTLVPLKPKVLATKGALGTEHPYGDALDVAETFLASGGEQVMMYNSNYYGVFGVTADYRDYSEVLENTIAPYIYEWKQVWKDEHGTPDDPYDELGKIDIDKAIIYIPINEGTPVVGAPNTNVAWEAYYDAIKTGDPDATIAGPNSAAYGSQFMNTNFRAHIQYCADNDCMPDIITWHELQTNTLQSMSAHMDDFNNIWAGINWTKWLQTHDQKLEMPQIVINEYAEMKDCGVPGALVNWIARLEDEKIYGCLPFWQQANNLNGLTSDANEGAGAWWVYKWYGDMSGQTLEVETSTSYERLYGVASIDEQKQMASVLMGGEDGTQTLVLENLGDTAVFAGEDKVHVTVQKAAYNGYAGTVNEVPTILDGVYPVAEDGSVEITIPDAKYADAFYVMITKAGDEEVSEPLVSEFSDIYEAELAQHGNLTRKARADYNPTYYFSGGYAMLLAAPGDKLTYEIEVPVDGKYQLNFLYGNGTGSSRNDMYNHKPLNVKQSYQIDGGEKETVIMESTLFTAITDCYTKYVDLTAGTHTISITNDRASDTIHDALIVTYAGAYGENLPLWRGTYEAEQADFNTLSDCEESSVVTKTEKSGYSGNGYVTGLDKTSVEDGGGIRWNVVVEDSGMYNFTLRYQAAENGEANIYIGNSHTTLDSLSNTVSISATGSQWKTVTASIYLQKGINIVDVDADVDAALDYLKVQQLPESVLGINAPVVIEAEDCIPEGSAIAVEDSEGASEGGYVVGFEGDKDAESDVDKYLEFPFYAPEDGIYELQIFQSNDDICGSHSYNIKIIDKYASVQVKNEAGEVTGEDRYFFINTSSDDTFKEKTVQVELEEGENTIKIFNDDSWHVTWGGTTFTPGLNELDNYTPNFDKFILTPMTLTKPAEIEVTYQIDVKATAGGYAVVNKNEVAAGESAKLVLTPDTAVESVLVEGRNVTDNLKKDGSQYVLTLNNIQEDQQVQVYFAQPTAADIHEEQMDEMLTYFVDCGDHGPTTLTGSDLFGTNNSVTDQIYGEDAVTGYSWGVVTSAADYVITQSDNGVYTNYQWANEWDVSDGLGKTETFRYAHNQLESGIATRYVKYQFELDPDKYEVSVCMGNTWGNAGNPQIYLNDTKISANSFTVAANTNAITTGTIDLTNAEINANDRVILEVRAESSNPTIQMNYITIAPDREFADMSKLQVVYDEAQNANEADYTPDSWADFQEALADAEALLAEENIPYSRQPEVNAARKTLQKAYDGLEKKPVLPYTDVEEGIWYYDAVYYNYIAGTMTGKSDTIFAPDESLARGQFASILYRIEGSPEVEFTPEFADVEEGIWYTAPILWAKAEGIVNGYANGNFGPGDMITREQMAIMMYNYAVSKGYDVSETKELSAFKDAASVSEYAVDEVKWAVGAGIISGKENGTILDPQGETARAQCAVIIKNFMEKYAE